MNDSDEFKDDLLPLISQLTEVDKTIIKEINYNGIKQISNIISDAYKPLIKEVNKSSIFDFLESSDLNSKIVEQMSSELKKQYISSNALNGFADSAISGIAQLQASTSLWAELSKESEMLQSVIFNLSSLNLQGCINAIQKVLNSTQILTPDLLFLKASKLIPSIKKELIYPKGLLNNISVLNKLSLERLMHNKSIVYNYDQQSFIEQANKKISTDVSEMNSICCFERIIEDSGYEESFTEEELIGFMTFLSSTPMMAMNNPVGIKIYNAIKKMNRIIDFDKDLYYHGKSRNKNDAPYVWEQMKTAPYGVVGPGRFNHQGQAHFYFADTINGANEEICKHILDKNNDNKTVQVVEIQPNSHIKMLDLSEKYMRNYNVFLKYIRFPLNNDSSNMPRVYLIPSFVSDCCFASNIAGIKYYGGKEYSNYVTWDASYFDYVKNVL